MEVTASPIEVQRILLDSVWLADEIEARSEVIPDRHAPLELGVATRDDELGELEAAQGIELYLSQCPGASRITLEQNLPFSPVTIGYALARLCEEGRVRHKLKSRDLLSQDAASKQPALRTSIAPGSLFRLALVFVPGQYNLVPDLVARLCERSGRDRGASFFDPSGVSFIRVRLADQRLLSITTLPVTLRNRFVFESIMPSLELAIFLTDGHASRELEHWMRLVPSATSVMQAQDSQSALEQLEAGLALAGVEESAL